MVIKGTFSVFDARPLLNKKENDMNSMNIGRHPKQKVAIWLRLRSWLMALTGILLTLPTVNASFSNSSRDAQDESSLRIHSLVSPHSASPIQHSRIDLPSRRYQIEVDPESVDVALPVLASIGQTDSNQIGVGRRVGIASDKYGKLIMNQDGSRIRLLTIASPDAVGVRVYVEHFDIAPGDEVYAYGKSPDREAAGPYTLQGPFGDWGKSLSEGAFWSDTVEGDTVVIEHYMKGEERGFEISEISHLYRGIPGNQAAPNVLSCHNDAMCFGDIEKDAVGRILYTVGGSTFVCTGTMMNNRTGDGSPYFYTASHCVSTPAVAQTVETYWFYRTTACNSGVVSGNWVRTQTGASLLATRQTADATLLRILKPVPGNLVYAGWDSATQSPGTSIFGLSHPGGGIPPSSDSYLRRSVAPILTTDAACTASGLMNGYTVVWSSGSVEPGSSGSSIFSTVNGNSFVVGVLSCGPTNPVCGDFAFYGKFSDFFPTIQPYMDLGDNGGVCSASQIAIGQTINGALASTDCKSRVRGLAFNSDRFSFRGTGGQQVAISLSSTTVDTYLYLLGSNKTVIAEDNNGGGGSDSRIPSGSGFFTLPSTGDYVIEVSSSAPNASGNYVLTLRGPTPPVEESPDTAGLYDASSSTFYLRNSNTPGVADLTLRYGPAGAGWLPLAGDWNGDGTDTIGLYNPSTSTFYLRNSNTPGVADVSFGYGPAGAGWLPLAGDWNGDGIDTIALYNPSTSTFYLRNSNTPGVADVTFWYGPAGGGWLPLAGDWNGDGIDTIGLYNPSASTFYLRNSNTAGVADVTFWYGPMGSGWLPLAGNWNSDRIDTIGLYNPSTSTVYLRNSNTAGVADVTFAYGQPGAGWKPLVGNWNGLP